jgi:hypothetical protein
MAVADHADAESGQPLLALIDAAAALLAARADIPKTLYVMFAHAVPEDTLQGSAVSLTANPAWRFGSVFRQPG